ncbi:hypothetical protein E2320_021854 [Naja naja]|nr:hypothetical protein E2320_021854 [Naja naja]
MAGGRLQARHHLIAQGQGQAVFFHHGAVEKRLLEVAASGGRRCRRCCQSDQHIVMVERTRLRGDRLRKLHTTARGLLG